MRSAGRRKGRVGRWLRQIARYRYGRRGVSGFPPVAVSRRVPVKRPPPPTTVVGKDLLKELTLTDIAPIRRIVNHALTGVNALGQPVPVVVFGPLSVPAVVTFKTGHTLTAPPPVNPSILLTNRAGSTPKAGDLDITNCIPLAISQSDSLTMIVPPGEVWAAASWAPHTLTVLERSPNIPG